MAARAQRNFTVSSQTRDRTPLDSILVLCFVQSRLHLPLPDLYKTQTLRPKILIMKMVSVEFSETLANLQAELYVSSLLNFFTFKT
jgi:hypothetical protein